MLTRLLIAVLFSIPSAKLPAPPRPLAPTVVPHVHKGKWYMSQDGHAVFCYGSVITIPDNAGGLQRVATFCSNQAVVVLHN